MIDINDLYPQIFEIELWSCYKDESCRPEKRDYKTFKEWFDIKIHSMAAGRWRVEGFQLVEARETVNGGN
jgi:hypothetical protein